MRNGSVTSWRSKDDLWRTLSVSVAAMACMVSFYFPGHAVTAAILVLGLCLAALNEIWQRLEAIRFMMELRLDREGAFGPNLSAAGKDLDD